MLDLGTATAVLTPFVQKVIEQLMPYIVTGIVSVIVAIITFIGNILHREFSNNKVIASNQAVVAAITAPTLH